MALSQNTVNRMADWYAKKSAAAPGASGVHGAPDDLADGGLLNSAHVAAPENTTVAPAPSKMGGAASPKIDPVPAPAPAPAPDPATAPVLGPIKVAADAARQSGPSGPTPVPGPAAPNAEAKTGDDLTITDETNPNAVAQINKDELAERKVDAEKETVAGQIRGLLAENSDYLQGFRDRAARAANRVGLLNSSMAVTAGEEAAVNAALPIASADAGVYGKAADYNVSAQNQATMFNADALNKMSAAQLEAVVRRYVADTSAAAQVTSASIHASATTAAAAMSAEASRYRTDADARIAAQSDATRRYEADQNNATRRYDIDQATGRQNSANHNTLINSILNNNDMPPEIRARLLREMGEQDLADAIFIAGGEDDDDPYGIRRNQSGPPNPGGPGAGDGGGG